MDGSLNRPALDDQGCRLASAERSEAVADHLAQQAGIRLTAAH